MHVYMSVCIYVFMYVRMYACMYVCVCAASEIAYNDRTQVIIDSTSFIGISQRDLLRILLSFLTA